MSVKDERARLTALTDQFEAIALDRLMGLGREQLTAMAAVLGVTDPERFDDRQLALRILRAIEAPKPQQASS